MITAREAYKKTKIYIDDPEYCNNELYHKFSSMFENSSSRMIIDSLIKKSIEKKMFKSEVFFKSNNFLYELGNIKMEYIKKFYEELGFKITYNKSDRISYTISWSNINE